MRYNENLPLDSKKTSYKFPKNLLYIIFGILTFSGIVTVALISNILLGKHQVQSHGAVSSDVKVCSEIGVEQMKKKGTAVDAAIATMFCLGVVNSGHSGIGGGGFMLIYSHVTNESHAIDFRETLPFSVSDPSINEGTSIGVPGEVKGMYLAHKLYGKLQWRVLIEPAINLAENGYIMTLATVKSLHKKFESPLKMMTHYPLLAEIYVKKISLNYTSPKQYRFVKVGETTTNLRLANSLRLIANHGPEALYQGPLAAEIVKVVQAKGGLLTLEDLYTFQPVLRRPYSFNLMKGRYRALTFPLPASGPVLALILQIIEKLGLSRLTSYSDIDGFHNEEISEEKIKKVSNGISDLDVQFFDSLTQKYPSLKKVIINMQEKDGSSPEDLVSYFDSFADSGEKKKVGKSRRFISEKIIETPGYERVKNKYFKNLPATYTALYYHWLVEALKFSQAHAHLLGDPTSDSYNYTYESMGTNDDSLSNNLHYQFSSDKPYSYPDLRAIVHSISNDTTFDFSSGHYNIPPINSINKVGTAHVSVIDDDELMVSVTSTLNNIFGSKIITKHGILLNDEMNDFTSPPEKNGKLLPNAPRAGKRPLSNMVPTIIYEIDKPCGLRLVIGGSNGSRIISGVAQVLLNLLALGDTLPQAIARPRIYMNLDTNRVDVEEHFPDKMIQELSAKNHNIFKVPEGLNSVIPIMKIKDTLWATSDPRKSEVQSAAIY
ncbi:glutathione hydrolase 1 proenzyme-like isoform X2 [Gordionus sp. m RMFG-2023]|uniref:glutathione hydrolase 1 proenzyme-like isoform X2 n=1 Tax=Gordionus sp. m RMFG-2023 TaxID=3053472 RepID=UPI0031FE37F5